MFNTGLYLTLGEGEEGLDLLPTRYRRTIQNF
jgi:hypothetical protein